MRTNIVGSNQNRQQLIERINKGYDNWFNHDFISAYYQKSMYMNWGYWNDKTRNVKEACDNMVDTLLSFIEDKQGNILEVACGAGGVTKRLCNYYDPSKISAINISKTQLREANNNAPGCNFMLMDATDLHFRDGTFDNIISVEAAFHFNPRMKFLNEAYRVLKPDGKLVMSDILSSPSLFSHLAKRIKKRLFAHKKPTDLKLKQGTPSYKKPSKPIDYTKKEFIDLEEYRNLFVDAGFKNVVILDITKDTFDKFLAGMIKTVPQFTKGAIGKSIAIYIYCLAFFLYFKIIRPIDNYLLISATK